MGNLKLGAIEDDKPVKLTIELPAGINRDLLAYADVLSRDGGAPVDPARLIAPMLSRFMATDREFAKRRRSVAPRATGSGRSAEIACTPDDATSEP